MTHLQTQDDEALVRVVAEAEAQFDRAIYRDASYRYGVYPTREAFYEGRARSILTALRNHEGRK